jgi:two-component system, LytTR family, response regulator
MVCPFRLSQPPVYLVRLFLRLPFTNTGRKHLNKLGGITDYFTSRYQDLLRYPTTTRKYKNRFLVKKGKELASVLTENIAYFYAIHKLVCLVDETGGTYILDSSLSDIEKQLDPLLFLRTNRKLLVHLTAIKKISALPKCKLQIGIRRSLPMT